MTNRTFMTRPAPSIAPARSAPISFREDGDVRQLPELVVEVQTIAHNESVGNLKTAVVRLERQFLAALFSEQDSDSQGGDFQPAQVTNEMGKRASCIQNVVDQENVPSAHVGDQLGLHLKRAWRGAGASIAGSLDKANLHRHVESAHQVSQKDQAAGEHADDGNGPAGKVSGDLSGHFRDALADAIGRYQHLHGKLTPSPRSARKIVLNINAGFGERAS